MGFGLAWLGLALVGRVGICCSSVSSVYVCVCVSAICRRHFGVGFVEGGLFGCWLVVGKGRGWLGIVGAVAQRWCLCHCLCKSDRLTN